MRKGEEGLLLQSTRYSVDMHDGVATAAEKAALLSPLQDKLWIGKKYSSFFIIKTKGRSDNKCIYSIYRHLLGAFITSSVHVYKEPILQHFPNEFRQVCYIL